MTSYYCWRGVSFHCLCSLQWHHLKGRLYVTFSPLGSTETLNSARPLSARDGRSCLVWWVLSTGSPQVFIDTLGKGCHDPLRMKVLWHYMLQGLVYFSITWQVWKSSYSQVFPCLELRWDHKFFFLLYLTAFGRSLPIFVCVCMCVCVCVCVLLSCPFSHFFG